MRSPHRYLARIGCLALVALSGSAVRSGAVQAPERPTEPGLATAFEGYTAWTRVTRTPYRVAPAVNVLCAASTAVQANPHAGAYIHVYVNETGREAMLTHGQVTFPVGTVIVKEKRQAERSSEPTLLTVMVKRAKGYNPTVGDWEFAVVDGTATRVEEQGRLTSCMECHKTVTGSDYVFRTYLEESQ